jgi:hypothetical protein
MSMHTPTDLVPDLLRYKSSRQCAVPNSNRKCVKSHLIASSSMFMGRESLSLSSYSHRKPGRRCTLILKLLWPPSQHLGGRLPSIQAFYSLFKINKWKGGRGKRGGSSQGPPRHQMRSIQIPYYSPVSFQSSGFIGSLDSTPD